MPVCGQCGTTLLDETTVCGACGWQVPAGAAEMTQATPVPTVGAPAQGAPGATAAAPPKKKKGCLGCALALLAVLFFLFVVVAGGGAWWYFKGGGKQVVQEKLAQMKGSAGMPSGEEFPPPPEEPTPEGSGEAYEPEPEPEAQPEAEPLPEVTPEEPAPQPPPQEPPQIVVDRPALRAAKERAEVALKSFQQALREAEVAGAEGGDLSALIQRSRDLERAYSRADTPKAFDGVARDARVGVERATELKARAQKPPEPAPSTRRSPVSAPEAYPTEPLTPPPKERKASFGFIFETPVDGKRIVLKVDGDKVLDQEFRAVTGTYRLAKNFTVAPGMRHLRAAVHQSDGQVLAHEWDFDFQPGTVPVFKVELEKTPRQIHMKRVQ